MSSRSHCSRPAPRRQSTLQTAVLSPRNARVRNREEFTMATKRNHQLGIVLKLFMVTVVAILGVLFSRPPAAASDKADPLVYVVTAPVDLAGTTAQFGTVDLATGAFHQIGPYTPEPEANLVPGPHGELLSLTFSGN